MMRSNKRGSVVIGIVIAGTAMLAVGLSMMTGMSERSNLFSRRTQAQGKRSTAEAGLRAMLSDRTALALTRQYPTNATLAACVSGGACPAGLTNFDLLDDTGAVLIPAGGSANFDDFARPCPTLGQVNPASGALCRWRLSAQFAAHPFTPPGFPAQPTETVCAGPSCIDVYFTGQAVLDASVTMSEQAQIADIRTMVRGVHRSLFFPDASYSTIDCATRTDCQIYDSTGSTLLGTGQCDYLQGFDTTTGAPRCAAKRKGATGAAGDPGSNASRTPGTASVNWNNVYPPPCDAGSTGFGTQASCDVCGLVTLFDCDASASSSVAAKRSFSCAGRGVQYGCPVGFTMVRSCWVKTKSGAGPNNINFGTCSDGDDYSATCLRNGKSLPAGAVYSGSPKPDACFKGTHINIGKNGTCYPSNDCSGTPICASCSDAFCEGNGGSSLKVGSKCLKVDPD